jgi:hypothetical protein
MLGDVPVEIPLAAARKLEGEGRLADLPRAGDEDHLPLQVGQNLIVKVPASERHEHSVQTFSPTV